MPQSEDLIATVRADLNAKKGYSKRKAIDLLTTFSIKAGGVGVVFSVVLIFFYLVSVVLPLFENAQLIPQSVVPLVSSEKSSALNSKLVIDVNHSKYFGTEEYGEVITNITASGQVQFFKSDGQFISQTKVKLEAGDSIKQVSVIAGKINALALISNFGNLYLLEQKYQLNYPNGKRVVIPSIEMPFGEEPISLSAKINSKFSVFLDDENLTVGYTTDLKTLNVDRFSLQQDFLSDSLSLESEDQFQVPYSLGVVGLMLANDGRWLYLASENGQINLFKINDTEITEVDSGHVADNAKITTVAPLLGNYSLLVGDSKGQISQWFGYRDKKLNQLKLAEVRSFRLADTAITEIISEQQRKGFVALDQEGTLGVFFTTSEKTLLKVQLEKTISAIAINGNSEKLLVVDKSNLTNFQLINSHPEISFSSLWGKVWYESYSEPEYVWQSSASTNDFEPKFSLAPLTYGTLKAAFYALIFAIPLALFGAIYTAFFMSPVLRSKVKPTIEIMEALPTVILGFLAGLWLAPFIELHLTGVFLFLILTPVVTLIMGFAYHNLPGRFRHSIPEGWRPILLIPLIALIAYTTTKLSVPVETLLFDGNARVWMRDELGITFDQRNALVVGIAMGFAVIPTIFSIAEDALFSVPKHLVAGSLALGANPWQTLVKVVLPTASPGIFSGVMIGMGRAVGETMIVLMATGNTPIMNINIFEGMRTLAANIAVEMPEAELASSHYRILFLAALVLFGFTFIANSLAEIIRHRLRKKYSSL